MPTAIEARIADALLARLAALSLTPAIPVAYPDIPFTPPAGTYLKAQLIPNTNSNRYVGDDSTTEFRGILQVTVVASSGKGIVAPSEIAAKVADHFERGVPITSGDLVVKITDRPSIAHAMQDTDRVNIPVSINYYAFA